LVQTASQTMHDAQQFSVWQSILRCWKKRRTHELHEYVGCSRLGSAGMPSTPRLALSKSARPPRAPKRRGERGSSITRLLSTRYYQRNNKKTHTHSSALWLSSRAAHYSFVTPRGPCEGGCGGDATDPARFSHARCLYSTKSERASGRMEWPTRLSE
jgi:hypothetical protein